MKATDNVNIDLPSDTERALKELAGKRGKSAEDYASELLSEHLKNLTRENGESPENSAATNGKKSKPSLIPEPDPEPNLRWLKAHKAEYAGQWVALDGERLIAAGETEREVAGPQERMARISH